MFLTVFGLKAPVAEWCGAVLAGLARHGAGDTVRLRMASSQELMSALLGSRGTVVIEVSRPDAMMRQVFLGGETRFAVAVDSPRLAVRVEPGRDQAVEQAVLATLADCAALVEIVKAGRHYAVRAADILADPAAALHGLAEHFGLGADPVAVEAVLHAAAGESARVRQAYGPGHEEDAGPEPAGLPPADRVIVDAALAGADEALAEGAIGRLIATRQMFWWQGQDSSRPAVEPADATGRARLLAYGPHFALPPGEWTAQCVYGFSDDLVGASFTVDVFDFADGACETLARSSFTVSSGGRQDVTIRFVQRRADAQLEVRLFVDRAVFNGMLTLGYVEFQRYVRSQDTLEPAFVDPPALAAG